MGNISLSKAQPAKDSLLFRVVPRKRRTIRPATKGILGEEMADQSKILVPERQQEPRKKQKRVIENAAEQSNKDSAAHQLASSRKKRKQAAADDDCNDVLVPCFRVRGGTRGNRQADSRQLDSKTFQERFEYIWNNFPGERKKSFSCLDCLWFNSYSNKTRKERVLSWAEKHKDLFSKKYVIVPIVMWSHWNLLILCNFGESQQSPCMLLLDSLQSGNSKGLEPLIRKFVSDIYNLQPQGNAKSSSKKIPFLVPKVPQQRDGEECGRFVLYFFNLFLEQAPEDFSLSEGYPYFMKKDWFKFEDFDHFCKRLEEGFKASISSSSDEDVVEVSK